MQLKWIDEGFQAAQDRLNGIAAPTLVIDSARENKREFAYLMEGSASRKTDLAIIQKKIIPLVDYLKQLVRSGQGERAKQVIDEFKKVVILMFRRGVVDTDFGGTLANYGVDEKTGKIFVFDFGDLSQGIICAYKFADFIDDETKCWQKILIRNRY
ncbi:MAG: hypothetical protein NTZ48_00460 [Candidatus Omnitrophica bacterium]|nr:hypothetical protein [Candidatus Omnitrophota bacterium]